MTDDQPGPDTVETLRRIRAWTVSSWRHGTRAGSARSALSALAALAGRADGRPRPEVPDAGLHALSDQLAVLVDDALTAGADADEVEKVLGELAFRLRLSPA